MSFEEKITQIESLIEKFKDENLTLQESLEAYKQADKLIKEASNLLENAKAQINEIDQSSGDEA